MRRMVKELNRKKCVWIVTVLLISLLSTSYVMSVLEIMTDAMVGNNIFIALLVLLLHMLIYLITKVPGSDLRRSLLIGTLLFIPFVFINEMLFEENFTFLVAVKAFASIFIAGHICNYIISKYTKFFWLFLGEGALFLMNYLVPVLSVYSITLFGVLLALAFYNFPRIYHDPEMKVFFTIKARALFGLLDIYASFALVGHNAFLKNVTFDITIIGIAAYCLCLFILFPLLILLTYGLVKIRHILKKEATTDFPSGKRVQITCFVLMVIPLLCMSMGYYPGAITPDGVYQWCLVMGVYPIDNSHPAIHTLFLKMCSLLARTPYMVVIVHILLFSLLWSCIFRYLFQKGKLREDFIYLMSFTVAVLPNNYMVLFLVSKNILYALVVLCTTYLFVRLYASEKFLNSRIILFFGVDLAFLYLVRHNGFIGTIMACIMLAGLAVIKLFQGKRGYCVKITLIIITALCSIAIIKGPVYSYFGVTQNSSSTYTSGPLTQAVGMYYLADKEIPVEVKDTVDRIGSKEQWLKYYNPYDGDKLGWSELKGAISATNKDEMFKLYFTLLKDDPLLVIKARLNAIDLLWNIVEPTKNYIQYGAQNVKFNVGIWANHISYVEALPDLLREEYKQENGAYAKPNLITRLCGCLNSISYQNGICNSVFWRNGMYVVLLLWLFIINGLEKNKNIILAGLIPLSTLGSLALAASWQIYQYYWFFPICVLLLALATIAEKENAQNSGI